MVFDNFAKLFSSRPKDTAEKVATSGVDRRTVLRAAAGFGAGAILQNLMPEDAIAQTVEPPPPPYADLKFLLGGEPLSESRVASFARQIKGQLMEQINVNGPDKEIRFQNGDLVFDATERTFRWSKEVAHPSGGTLLRVECRIELGLGGEGALSFNIYPPGPMVFDAIVIEVDIKSGELTRVSSRDSAGIESLGFNVKEDFEFTPPDDYDMTPGARVAKRDAINRIFASLLLYFVAAN